MFQAHLEKLTSTKNRGKSMLNIVSAPLHTFFVMNFETHNYLTIFLLSKFEQFYEMTFHPKLHEIEIGMFICVEMNE